MQVEAAQSAGGVSAFSKELNKLHKPSKIVDLVKDVIYCFLLAHVPSFATQGLPLVFAAQAEIDELERLIFQYQHIEDDEQGDLLDDFVLSATLVRFQHIHFNLDSCHCYCLPHCAQPKPNGKAGTL